jgi:hypothetical protein
MKKIREQGTIFEKERSELFRNRENTVTMATLKEFEGHGSGAFFRIEIAAGRTKAAFTTERNELELTAMRAAIEGKPF